MLQNTIYLIQNDTVSAIRGFQQVSKPGALSFWIKGRRESWSMAAWGNEIAREGFWLNYQLNSFESSNIPWVKLIQSFLSWYKQKYSLFLHLKCVHTVMWECFCVKQAEVRDWCAAKNGLVSYSHCHVRHLIHLTRSVLVLILILRIKPVHS